MIVVSWLSYLAAYMLGGAMGLLGALILCGATRQRLREENAALRARLDELGTAAHPQTAHSAPDL